MTCKRYKNIVMVETEKDALVLGAKEGATYADIFMRERRPMRIVIQKERIYLEALLRSIQYSNMGLFNIFVQADGWSE